MAGRRRSIHEKVEQIVAALEGGASKASVCRTFRVPRSTLIDTLARVGWMGPMFPPEKKAAVTQAAA